MVGFAFFESYIKKPGTAVCQHRAKTSSLPVSLDLSTIPLHKYGAVFFRTYVAFLDKSYCVSERMVWRKLSFPLCKNVSSVELFKVASLGSTCLVGVILATQCNCERLCKNCSTCWSSCFALVSFDLLTLKGSIFTIIHADQRMFLLIVQYSRRGILYYCDPLAHASDKFIQKTGQLSVGD